MYGREAYELVLNKRSQVPYIEISLKLLQSMVCLLDYDVRHGYGAEIWYRTPGVEWREERPKLIIGRNYREHQKMLRALEERDKLREKARTERKIMEKNVTLDELEKIRKRLSAIETGEQKKRKLIREQLLEISSRLAMGGE